jgi:hypothetical protein
MGTYPQDYSGVQNCTLCLSNHGPAQHTTAGNQLLGLIDPLLCTGCFADEVVTTLYPLLGENPTWRWVYTMQEDGHIALRFSADPSATTSAAPPVYTQQPVQVTGPATPVPQPGRQAASHGVPEHLRSQGVQPVHEHWQLLQQLTEAGVVLDFTI